ncbi:hypothetical protein INR49_018989 [Caranx melampygus]|nr:hypothetical protein INR49_018989 [Caranx melampygus]
MESLRVLELYSGIGGMHYALKESGIPAQVVAAIDINTTANQIYRHNFPDTPLWNKTIEGITLDDFNKLSFDMMIGLQGDISDPRTKSFLYVLDILPRLHRPPRYILLENVKGFEKSAARDLLVKALTGCGYRFQELMVSPTSVGIPNSRLRYFLIAKMSTEDFSTQLSGVFPHLSDSSEKLTCPSSCQSEGGGRVLYKLETSADAERKRSQNQDLSIRQIQDFLEPEGAGHLEQLLLTPPTLLRYALLLDIVQASSRRSVCFTKGYGRYVEGTGSVLQSCTNIQVDCVFSDLDQVSEDEKVQKLLKLKLRYFSPREVANLMGFPPHFSESSANSEDSST